MKKRGLKQPNPLSVMKKKRPRQEPPAPKKHHPSEIGTKRQRQAEEVDADDRDDSHHKRKRKRHKRATLSGTEMQPNVLGDSEKL